MEEVELADSRPKSDREAGPEPGAHNHYDEQQPLVPDRGLRKLRLSRGRDLW